MKIKNKLSLQFTLMFALLLIVVLVGIYALVENNRKENFYDKLEDRALTAGQLYLAEDNMTKENFDKVIKKYTQSLTHEVIRVYNDQYQPVFIKEDSVRWPKEIIRNAIEQKTIRFTRGKEQIVGLYYVDNSGNFVVMASAIDDNGYQAMKELALILTSFFFASLIITFFLGRIFANVALSPINRIINGVKIIRATSLDKRLPESPQKKDEINQLSITINTLLEHLEQSFNDQQSFIANASHELRTPLTTILGESEIALHSERQTLDYKNTLAKIAKEAAKLNDIITSLLELAQVTVDSQNLQKIRIDEILWEVMDEWGKTPEGKILVTLNYNLPGDPSEFTINGNSQLLFIALSNVVKNAIKFSGNKEVQCTVNGNENEISVIISDSGIGISEKEMEKIFKPFYRATNALSFKGTGVGLSMAQKIIRLHNGKIEIESELGKGALFRIIIPRNSVIV